MLVDSNSLCKLLAISHLTANVALLGLCICFDVSKLLMLFFGAASLLSAGFVISFLKKYAVIWSITQFATEAKQSLIKC